MGDAIVSDVLDGIQGHLRTFAQDCRKEASAIHMLPGSEITMRGRLVCITAQTLIKVSGKDKPKGDY